MTMTYILRLWLPDRPGALGAVASRVGAVGGDVVGIDILERGAGRAIDELVVELPDRSGCVDLLHRRGPAGRRRRRRRRSSVGRCAPRSAPRCARDGGGAGRRVDDDRIHRGVVRARRSDGRRRPGPRWSHSTPALWSRSRGHHRTCAWLLAFVEGSQSSARANGDTQPAVADVVWSPLPAAGMALVLGRDGQLFRGTRAAPSGGVGADRRHSVS